MNAVSDFTRRRIHGVIFRLPGMINCEEFEDFILAYVEGDLPAPQRRVFERHMKVCRPCREYLNAYRRTLVATKSLAEADKKILEKVPEDLIAAILATHSDKNG